MRRLILPCALLASAALAQPTRPLLKDAVRALDAAAGAAFRAGGDCRSTVEAPVRDLAARLRGSRDSSGEGARDGISLISMLNMRATRVCPPQVSDALGAAFDALQEARVSSWGAPQHRHDRDRDDDDWDVAQLRPLVVQLNASYDNEPAVRVAVPELTLHHMDGETFYLGARFRAVRNDWTEWVTTQTWRVPSDPYVWSNAFQHFFRYSSLAAEDTGDGRFVAQVALFDGRGRQLALREANFTVRVPTLPVGPPPVVMPPVVPPPAQPMVDCGAGPDIGCTMMRDGRRPMDAMGFTAFLRTLRTTNNEGQRLQTVRSTFAMQYVTAVQFGLVLDLFLNEQLRFQAAEAGAPRVVNVQYAMDYEQKFMSAQFRMNYRALMAAQTGQRPPRDPAGPPPWSQPPPMRFDCGTGPQDDGCGQQRNGRMAMDATTFNGLVASVRNTPNDFTKRDMVLQVAGSGLTAMQLGVLMDQFNNELITLEVCRGLAPAVVDPRHAIGLSTKFRNSFNARDFIEVMSQQR